jgi:general secretion pathway protein F
LTVTDVALMTRQLATLLVAGLPLVDALGVLMDQTEKTIKGLIADVREAIRGGASYSAARALSRDFSSIYVHMVRAGEASGAMINLVPLG